MKKLICLIAVLCMALSLAACGQDTPTPDTTDAPQNQTMAPGTTEQDNGTEGTPSVSDGYTFTFNGTEIAMKAPAEAIIAALGEPKSYTEEASCAFTGLDKTYYYGSFYLTTFPQGEQDFVFSLWFADDSVATPEGVYIGAPQSEVEAAYGADSFNGSNAYILTKGETKLTVILKDGLVSSIQYDAIFD